jgi:hypothetical protein
VCVCVCVCTAGLCDGRAQCRAGGFTPLHHKAYPPGDTALVPSCAVMNARLSACVPTVKDRISLGSTFVIPSHITSFISCSIVSSYYHLLCVSPSFLLLMSPLLQPVLLVCVPVTPTPAPNNVPSLRDFARRCMGEWRHTFRFFTSSPDGVPGMPHSQWGRCYSDRRACSALSRRYAD